MAHHRQAAETLIAQHLSEHGSTLGQREREALAGRIEYALLQAAQQAKVEERHRHAVWPCCGRKK